MNMILQRLALFMAGLNSIISLVKDKILKEGLEAVFLLGVLLGRLYCRCFLIRLEENLCSF